jgi:hypothetical protein
MSGIYAASLTKHAPRRLALRAAGAPLVSTWLDEWGPGESPSMRDLWIRNVREAAAADALVLYHEAGDVLKGAFVEVGAALACDVPVFVVGDPPGSWVAHPSVHRCPSLNEALRQIRTMVRAPRVESM